MVPSIWFLAAVSWQHNVFVLPKHNFMMCIIHKSASTAWLNVVRKMSGLEYRNASNPAFSAHYPPDGLQPLRLSTFDLKVQRAMLVNASWLKFVTIRDPMARLLSAWKQKVHDMNDTPWMLKLYASDLQVDVAALANVSFAEFVRRISERLPHVNDHYKPQIDQCGLRANLRNYVVVDITQDDMLEQTMPFLQTKLHMYSSAVDELNDMDDALMNASSEKHLTHSSSTIWQQPFELRSKIHNAYAEDYVLLESALKPSGLEKCKKL